MIDDHIHRIFAARLKERDRGHDQHKTSRPAGLGKGDQPRMYRFAPEERFEVADIFGDDHAILRDAEVFDRMVELTTSSDL